MAVVSLKQVVDAMDLLSSECEAFLDPASGEITIVTEDDRSALEHDEPESLPDWQREHMPKIRAVLESDLCLRLPDSFEIDDWSIMERFCHSVGDAEIRETLLNAINGRGAFRAFRSTVDRVALSERWHSFRQSEYERCARQWLESQHIQYK